MATISLHTRSVLDRLEIGPDQIVFAKVADDDTELRYPQVLLSRAIYNELGQPFEITVTISPGDRNQVEHDDQFSEHVHPFDADIVD